MQPHANPNPTELASASQAGATTPAPEAPTDPTNAPHGVAWNTKGPALGTPDTPDPEATLTGEPLLIDEPDDEPEPDDASAPPVTSARVEAATERALRHVFDRLLWPALLWLIALGFVGSCVTAVLGCVVTCVRYGFPVPMSAKVVGGLSLAEVAVLLWLSRRFAAQVKG